MEFLELFMIAPILYIVLVVFVKVWNSELDRAYNEAQLQASILLGQGQKVEAMQVMDRAMSDLRRFKVRKVLGYKL